MIKKCLFPAAGYGTRFLPATKAMPKEMLPVVNKPLIQYGVEEALDAGLTEISIVTGRGKRALEDHFDISYELENQIKGTDKEKYLVGIRRLLSECSFSYTRQTEMKGLGHAILTGRPLIGDEPFAVILADDLLDGKPAVMKQMTDVFEAHQSSVLGVLDVPRSETRSYGIVRASHLSERLERIEGIGKTQEFTPVTNPTEQANYRPISMPMPQPVATARQPNSLWRVGSRTPASKKLRSIEARNGEVGAGRIQMWSASSARSSGWGSRRRSSIGSGFR